MAAANAAYYASHDPLGSEGDFITAPEISQIFGELIGLWCVDLCTRAKVGGAHYVELGPGRGTLAADALRAARRYGWSPTPHFVESSPIFRARLTEKFPTGVLHDDIGSLPENGPLLIVANEFFDALPIHQYVRVDDGWRERLVGHDETQGFAPVTGDQDVSAFVPASLGNAAEGSPYEAGHAAAAVMTALSGRVARQGGALLVIDYGHVQSGHGDTLQAVHRHERADPFVKPGEHDLTAHVDFAALEAAAIAVGLRAAPPVTQGAFLGGLGAGPRAAALCRENPAEAEAIEAAVKRLTDPTQMGELFKVAAYYSPDWPDPAGF